MANWIRRLVGDEWKIFRFCNHVIIIRWKNAIMQFMAREFVAIARFDTSINWPTSISNSKYIFVSINWSIFNGFHPQAWKFGQIAIIALTKFCSRLKRGARCSQKFLGQNWLIWNHKILYGINSPSDTISWIVCILLVLAYII